MMETIFDMKKRHQQERLGLLCKAVAVAKTLSDAARLLGIYQSQVGKELKAAGIDWREVAKGGVNDLSKWETCGGDLKRPAPPSPLGTKEKGAT